MGMTFKNQEFSEGEIDSTKLQASSTAPTQEHTVAHNCVVSFYIYYYFMRLLMFKPQPVKVFDMG